MVYPPVEVVNGVLDYTENDSEAYLDAGHVVSPEEFAKRFLTVLWSKSITLFDIDLTMTTVSGVLPLPKTCIYFPSGWRGALLVTID